MIIGITGTLGAGKGTITALLQEKYGFKYFSVRGYLAEKIRERGGEVNRDTLTEMGNELRAQLGDRYFEEVLKPIYESGDNYVFESFRTPTEVAYMKKQTNTYLFAVDADKKIRYDRIYIRGSETDSVSFETFAANEEREWTNTDPSKQNLKYCIEQADYVFDNSGTFEDLHGQVDRAMSKLLNPST